MLFALMLFIKFVLPFYDLVVCTMLFFLPISTCKVWTNKFYDTYAISKKFALKELMWFARTIFMTFVLPISKH